MHMGWERGKVMSQWRKNLYVLWVGTFIAGMGFSLVSPFLPMMLRQTGVTDNLEMWSGLAFSASFFTSAVMSPIWGSFADKYGRKIMIVRSGLGIGTTYLLLAFATQAWHIVALRTFNGLLSGFIPASIALVATNTPEERLGRALGILQTGSAFGTIMGPLVGGVLSHYFGIRYALILGSVILYCASLITIVGVKEIRKPNRSNKTHIISDLRIAVQSKVLLTLLLTVMLFRGATMIIQPVLPIYIEQLMAGRDASLATGLIFSSVGLATVMAAPFWGRKGEKTGFKKILVWGLFGAALLSFPHALAPNLWVLGGLRFSFGIFLAALMPATNALIAKAVPGDFRGRAFGISNSFSQIGAVAGPLVGGFVGDLWNIQMVFVVTGLILLATTYWIKRRDVEQAGFVDFESITERSVNN